MRVTWIRIRVTGSGFEKIHFSGREYTWICIWVTGSGFEKIHFSGRKGGCAYFSAKVVPCCGGRI